MTQFPGFAVPYFVAEPLFRRSLNAPAVGHPLLLLCRCRYDLEDARGARLHSEEVGMSTVARHLAKPFGYSCQTWLSVDIANRFFGRSYRAWFSTSMNPPNNGSSSNPLLIYQELDRIVHTNDHNHSRVDQLRMRLANWIAGASLPAQDIASLLGEINSAPVPAFRPQLWKIDLSSVHVSRLLSVGQFPDEYQVKDLVGTEIEVIVE